MAEAPSTSTGGPIPRTLRQLCRLRGCRFPHITVFCHFCFRYLSVLDVYSFEQSGLNLIHREGTFTAVCVVCSRVLARFEFTARHELSCSASQAQHYIGSPITEVEVRCYRCFGSLIPMEKRMLLRDDSQVHKVAGSWRGLCSRCQMGFF